MTIIASFSSKGQLVVPKALRERHGWKEGDRVELIDSSAGVFLRAIPTAPLPAASAAVFSDIDALVAAASVATIDDHQAQAAAALLLSEADSRCKETSG